ncbi:hypothetical protein [Streptomyces sp. NPDC001415]
MTSNPADPTPVATNEKIQQIPAQITTAETPAATEARDALLTAIGAEARNLEKYPGKVSAQLHELARAFRGIATAGLAALNADQNAGIQIVLRTQIAGPVPREVAELWPKNAQSPAATEARNQLLAAIGAEAQNVAEQFPGQASAQLAELASAYGYTAYPSYPLPTGTARIRYMLDGIYLHQAGDDD